MECEWTGSSGKKYTYTIYGKSTNWNEVSGNYIFAKETAPGRWRAIYIGETKSFKTRLTSSHEKLPCADRNGFTHYHAHTNSGGVAARRSEESDLIDKYDPPCNKD